MADLLAQDLLPAGQRTSTDVVPRKEALSVYGDAAYGAGEVLHQLDDADAVNRCKVQPPTSSGGRFSKEAFVIELGSGTVTCPEGHAAVLLPDGDGSTARFGSVCASCQLAQQCTTAATGRTVHVGPHEALLAAARTEQADPAWRADYRATRPKVERKLAHLMRRRHGGRRARVRGQPKVAADFALLAAAVNLARLAALALVGTNDRLALAVA